MRRFFSLGIVLTLGVLLGILGFQIWDKIPIPVRQVDWSTEAHWISAQKPSYRFYARHTFYVADTVQTAWLRLSADNDFILYVNGEKIAREQSVLQSATSGLGSKLSLPFQKFNDSLSYYPFNSSEILRGSDRDWKVSAYVDLTYLLRPGKNVIALEIQKGQENPRFVLEGLAYIVPNNPINLTTGATTWQVATLAEISKGLQWFELNFPDQNWQKAKVMGRVQEATYSRLSPNLFNHFLQGSWVSGIESSNGEVWLRRSWTIPQTPRRAFIRFGGEGNYALMINGLLVRNYTNESGNRLHMYEVTNLLKSGLNTLAVRLARPLSKNLSTVKNKPLTFFLDGWVETLRGEIITSITTDSTWSSLANPISGWFYGKGKGQPALILELPNPQQFQRTFEGDAYLLNYPNNLLHQSVWLFGGICFALIFAFYLGRFWLYDRKSWWDSFEAGTGLLLPGTMFLIGMGLLQHRYAEAERGLLFCQPLSKHLILISFLVILFLTLLNHLIILCSKNQVSWIFFQKRCFLLGLLPCLIISISLNFPQQETFSSWFPSLLLAGISLFATILVSQFLLREHQLPRNWFQIIRQFSYSWGHWLILILIFGIGLGLRVYNLDAIEPDFDEYVSYDAARGILRTGAPEVVSGIWYTRSPAFHYTLAFWFWLFGDSIISGRSLSIFWGMVTLIFVYFFTRKVTGKVWIALLATVLLALDPWEIMYSRGIRFYQAVQALSLLSFWLFLKGFIERSGRWYQYSFLVVIVLATFHQELSVLLLPAFCLGFFFFYRPFHWQEEWQLIIGSTIALMSMLYNIIFFSVKSITPWVALSTGTDSVTKLHLSDVTYFLNSFFVSFNRISVIYSFFFFLGYFYFLKRKDSIFVYLSNSVIIYLIFLTLIVRQFGNRYAYPIFPLFIVLSIYSAVFLLEKLGNKFEFILQNGFPVRKITLCFLCLLLIGNTELDKLLVGYHEALLKKHIPLLEYFNIHKQVGDVMINATPSAHAVILGKSDYYILPALKTRYVPFDGVYWHDGRILDRWAGGVAISNVDQLIDVIAKANRVWIHQDDGKFEDLEERDADLAKYLQTLGQPIIESFGTRLRLWQREDGLFPRVPNQGKDLGSY